MKKNTSSEKQDKRALAWLEKYLRYVNYLGAAQLYLKDNFLLERPLKTDHIKDRVLGHWGTVPGLNLIYAHLDYLISKHKANMFYVCGPGHGAPAVLANLFAENTLADYYPDYTRDKKGTGKLLKFFSWPGGFPSHTNPGTPGSILEGGELGYSLATAYGAVMDNPDLIAACVVGDGEAESGPLATAWHGNKFLNPKTSGAVLPILHANGYKITSPTIYACMSDKELTDLFTGFGYEPRIVDCTKLTPHAHQKMIDTLEWAYNRIRAIQKKARASKKALLKPKWPMIVMRSLKGATGIKTLHNHKVEGTFHSHGIPAEPKKNKEDFDRVKIWLESYHVNELVDKKGRPLPEVLEFVPIGEYRMGDNKHTNGGAVRKELHLPDAKKYAVTISRKKADFLIGNTAVSSDYMRDMFVLNAKEKNFRFMCPDETESNKYQSLFEVTNRAFMWPLQAHDEHLSADGRVMEVLSEHNLIGWLQGYLLTGRHGVFVTYEAFAMIIASMTDQYAKFIKQAMRTKWRKPVSSFNVILTSIGWRQEHNGFSHQNPGYVSSVLEKHGKFSSAYFPADANSLLVTLEDCFKRTNGINVIVSSKNPLPQWITVDEARQEIKKGVGIWDWINPEQAKNPDVIFAASGDAMVQESMAAICLLRKEIRELKVRFVNVSELTALGMGDERHPLALDDKNFVHYFTADKPIIYNFHGYAGVIRNLLFGHEHALRFSIHGYSEEGTTTTPFEMMVLNKTSRYHLAIDALEKVSKTHKALAKKAKKVIAKLRKKITAHEKYIRKFGKDTAEISDWKWDYKK
ncbi:MAG TPA: phosphoketolase family protein [Candidatus Gracilibacteria bacterium]|nr:phosphoketolase family protein [Candidatus Gracilibacteria bacterium]